MSRGCLGDRPLDVTSQRQKGSRHLRLVARALSVPSIDACRCLSTLSMASMPLFATTASGAVVGGCGVGKPCIPSIEHRTGCDFSSSSSSHFLFLILSHPLIHLRARLPSSSQPSFRETLITITFSLSLSLSPSFLSAVQLVPEPFCTPNKTASTVPWHLLFSLSTLSTLLFLPSTTCRPDRNTVDTPRTRTTTASQTMFSTYSQATYSPLRTVQVASQDVDSADAIGGSNNVEMNTGHRRTHSSLIASRQPPYHTPPQHGNQRQFRKRSYSQSSNRTVQSITDQHQSSQQLQQPPLNSFAEGVEVNMSSTQQSGNIRMSSGSMGTASPANGMDRPLRRGSAIRSQSLMEESSPWAEDGYTDKPSPPPKYTVEDLQYSEPARLSVDRDEETGLILDDSEDNNKQGDGLLMQVRKSPCPPPFSTQLSCLNLNVDQDSALSMEHAQIAHMWHGDFQCSIEHRHERGSCQPLEMSGDGRKGVRVCHCTDTTHCGDTVATGKKTD